MLRLLAAIMKQHHSVPAEPPSLDEESTEERRVEAATAPTAAIRDTIECWLLQYALV